MLLPPAALNLEAAIMPDCTPPTLALSDAVAVAAARRRLRTGDPAVLPAYERLMGRAIEGLNTPTLTVTDKPRLPPSGDPHDYVSMSIYFWPNSSTPDGLPYVRKDGHVNPESARTDLGKFQRLCTAVPCLAWAFFLSADGCFAKKAVELIQTWFLEPATRMNPHLRYAGHIPGVVDGRSYGIADTKGIRFIFDAIGLLRADSRWTWAEESKMQAWVSAYLNWLLTSDFGVRESQAPNNHGTWYDVQVLAAALFVDDRATVEKIAQSAKARIGTQFTVEGAQPQEMARTRPLQYCMMNLHGFFELATMLAPHGLDLWNYATADGKSLRKAADWMLRHATAQEALPRKDVVRPKLQAYLSVFRRAAIEWGDHRFEEAIQRIDTRKAKYDLMQIQYPLQSGFIGMPNAHGGCQALPQSSTC